MKKTYLWISVWALLLFIPSASWSVIPVPARIGGTVTIDGVTLTDDTDDGYTIIITKQGGASPGPGAADTNGLSSNGWYILDIPLYNENSQTDGVNADDTVVIHVYKENRKLKVLSPVNGEVTVKPSGSTTQVDLVVENSSSPLTAILNLLLGE